MGFRWGQCLRWLAYACWYGKGPAPHAHERIHTFFVVFSASVWPTWEADGDGAPLLFISSLCIPSSSEGGEVPTLVALSWRPSLPPNHSLLRSDMLETARPPTAARPQVQIYTRASPV